MQGYLTLATGTPFYLDLAMNLVLSLKLNDPTRPVCIVTDRTMSIPESLPQVHRPDHFYGRQTRLSRLPE